MGSETRTRAHRGFATLDGAPPEVQLQVKDLAAAGQTIDEITEWLKTEAQIVIGRTAVWRWLMKRRNEVARIEAARDKAQMLAQYLVPAGATIEEGAIALVQALLMEALVDARPLQAGSIADITKIAHAIGRTQTSRVQREKWEHEKGRRIAEATQTLRDCIKELVARDEDLQQRLLALVDVAAESMMERVA